MPRTDEQIKKDVINRMSADDRIDARDIGVHVKDGHVELRGAVPTEQARNLAAREARHAEEVRVVENQLDVRAEQLPPSDEELRDQIQSALSNFLTTCDGQLQVSAAGGVVTVEGCVESLWVKVQVARIASEPTGVVDVQNRVEVVPREPLSDEAIARAIDQAIDWSELADRKAVHVQVRQGVVTLSGRVPSDSAAKVVLNAVVNTAGVKDIRNHVETRTP